MATSTVSSVLLLPSVILNNLVVINAYYLSYNGLLWSDAETFCIDHCNSHLASIHNDKQYTEIKTLINTDSLLSITSATGDGYWIGLNNTPSETYTWTDASAFDFGSNISGGVYPWLTNEPTSILPYGQLQSNTITQSDDLKWRTDSSTENALPICNDCDWTQLSKYILLRWREETWVNAETACNNDFGTNLASIHTNDDEEEAKLLCPFGRGNGGAYSCWIGLSDISSEGNFEWNDGTNLDLGWTKKTDPWANNQPDNYFEADCVVLSKGDGFFWDDQICADVNKVLCNRPSEICFESNWQKISAGPSFTWTSGSGCQLTDDATNDRGYHEVALDISDKNWYVITIGYTFKLTDWYVPGRIGIHMTIGDYTSSSTTTIWLGWWFVTDGNNGDNQRTFIEINDVDPPHLRRDNMDYILDETGSVFLELVVRLDELGRLTAKLYRGKQEYDIQINWNDLSSYFPTEYYIKDVGIKNYNMGTICKAFFINGGVSPHAPTSAPTTAPTNPSTSPTLAPSTFPSKSPSKSPFDQPSLFPTLSPNNDPTAAPTTAAPTTDPTNDPSTNPSTYPTLQPSITPTYIPSIEPTGNTTDVPSTNPSKSPSINPSAPPTSNPSSRPTPMVESPTDDGSASDSSTTLQPVEQSSEPVESDAPFFANNLVLGLLIGSAFFLCITVLILMFCCRYVKKIKKDSQYNERALSVESTAGGNTVSKPSKNINTQSSANQNNANLNEGHNRDDIQSSPHDLSESSSSTGVNQMYDVHNKSTPGDIIPTPSFSPVSNKVHVQVHGGGLDLRSNASDEEMYKNSTGPDLDRMKTPTMTPLQSVDTTNTVSPNQSIPTGIRVELEMSYIQRDDNGSYAKCIANYVASDEDQLDMKEDQVVFIRRELQSGWWYAVDDRNNDGWIPSNYVVKLHKEQEQMYQDRKRGSTYNYGDNYASNLDKYLNYTVLSEVSPVMKYIISGESDESSNDIFDLQNENTGNVTRTAQDSIQDV